MIRSKTYSFVRHSVDRHSKLQASLNGHLEVVKALVATKANPNVCNEFGKRPGGLWMLHSSALQQEDSVRPLNAILKASLGELVVSLD